MIGKAAGRSIVLCWQATQIKGVTRHGLGWWCLCRGNLDAGDAPCHQALGATRCRNFQVARKAAVGQTVRAPAVQRGVDRLGERAMGEGERQWTLRPDHGVQTTPGREVAITQADQPDISQLVLCAAQWQLIACDLQLPAFERRPLGVEFT